MYEWYEGLRGVLRSGGHSLWEGNSWHSFIGKEGVSIRCYYILVSGSGNIR